MVNSEIKILTLNTWKGEGDYFKRLRVMADQLKRIDPDIIACQKCFAIPDGNVNTLDFLARELNLFSYFTPARFKKRNFDHTDIASFSGLGLLSRYPITMIQELLLPSCDEDKERKIQIAPLNVMAEKKLAVINVHLTHLPNAVDLRNQQIQTITNSITMLHEFEAILLCGDFNATINSSELKLLTTLYGAADTYSLGKGKQPRLGAYQKNDFQIRKIVDYIFSIPNPSGEHPYFTDSRTVLNFPDKISGLFASDHPAVTTTLHLAL
jgi:endonuclease/exonuclease/phosphatase family metal-dependent hydrolase